MAFQKWLFNNLSYIEIVNTMWMKSENKNLIEELTSDIF